MQVILKLETIISKDCLHHLHHLHLINNLNQSVVRHRRDSGIKIPLPESFHLACPHKINIQFIMMTGASTQSRAKRGDD
jgi:hypothetical protein